MICQIIDILIYPFPLLRSTKHPALDTLTLLIPHIRIDKCTRLHRLMKGTTIHHSHIHRHHQQHEAQTDEDA